jgi:site-specific DNA recombinase
VSLFNAWHYPEISVSDRSTVRGKSAEPIIADGKYEAIISNALWEKVQFLLQKKSSTPSRIFDGEFLLSGLIRCPKCGAAMVASRTQSKTKT